MPQEIDFGGRRYSFGWWNGELLKGTAESPIGFDLETRKMRPYRQPLPDEDPDEIAVCPLDVPEPALGMACDSDRLVLIHPSKLGRFVGTHRGQHVAGHNVQFDVWVLLKHCDRATQAVVWEWLAQNRVHCSQTLDLLLQLATGSYRHGGSAKADDDAKLYPTNLGVLAAEYDCGELDKEDPWRLRFGELLGLSEAEITAHPEFGLLSRYALCDVIATHAVYPKQRAKAVDLMTRAGWSPDQRQKTYEILPTALARWGPLSEAIQVRAAVTLAELSRTALCVDQAARQQQENAARERYGNCMKSLLELEPEIFKRTKAKYRVQKEGKVKTRVLVQDSCIRHNKKTGLPQMDHGVLERRLHAEAVTLDIEPPLSKGKRKAISKSAKDWIGYATAADGTVRSQFLKSWCGLSSELKLMSFFLGLRADDGRVYAKYELLKRSGRTSATAHRDRKKNLTLPSVNVQQIPRETDDGDRDVRHLFLAPPGQKWITVDYKAIEMATLAAANVARFGFSRMREVIADNVLRGGPDLHQLTAAAVLREPVTAFLRRDPKEQSKRRKEAKEINFGFPGGMGVSRFCESTSKKGIYFTKKQAADAKKAWMDAYSEVKLHLSDHTQLALAWQSGLPASRVPKLSWLQRKRYSDYLKKKVELTPSEKEDFFDLMELLAHAKKDEQLIADVEGRQITPRVRRLFEYRASTITGRVRNNCTFSSGCNAVFQGLASDGAKEAIFELMRRGFKVVMFVHDEISAIAPERQAAATHKQMEKIMVDAMAAVVGHGVPIAVEGSVGNCWSKS